MLGSVIHRAVLVQWMDIDGLKGGGYSILHGETKLSVKLVGCILSGL